MALESTAVKRTANPNRENVENGRYGTMGRKWGAIAPKIQSWNYSSATDRAAQEKAQTARDSTRRGASRRSDGIPIRSGRPRSLLFFAKFQVIEEAAGGQRKVTGAAIGHADGAEDRIGQGQRDHVLGQAPQHKARQHAHAHAVLHHGENGPIVPRGEVRILPHAPALQKL